MNGHAAGTKAQEGITTVRPKPASMVRDLGFYFGAGDGNRTRTVSLGS
jgi:hypothetical protein